MAAGVRTFLILLFVVNVRSGLLPLDLSGVAPVKLLHLGLDTPNGGILDSLSGIVTSSTGTVGSLAHGVLGKLTALTEEHETSLPGALIRLEPWSIDFSYAAYQKYKKQQSKLESQLLTYGEWINKIHGDLESSPKVFQVTDPNLEGQIPKTINTNTFVKKESNIISPPKTATASSANQVLIDTINIPHSNTILKDPVKDEQTPQIPYVSTTPGKYENEGTIVLQPIGNQQSNVNTVYIMANVGTNLGENILIPVSSITTNPLKIETLSINPQTGQIFVFVPANIAQIQNPTYINNPVINYVTTPKHVNSEERPEVNDPEICEGTGSFGVKGNCIRNTKKESIVVDEGDRPTLEDIASLTDDDIRK